MSQSQRLPGTRTVAIRAVIVNDALCACNAVYGRINQRAELIDQLVLEKCTIDLATTLEKQLLDAEKSGKLFQSP